MHNVANVDWVLDLLQQIGEGGVYNVASGDWVLDWLQQIGEGGVYNVAKVDWVLDWLQQIGEGGVHNVANVDWVLDWLQQTGEGGVNNVAHNIIKGLKYKLRHSQISLHNLIANFTVFCPIFAHHQVLFIDKYSNYSVNMSTYKLYPTLYSNIHIKQPVYSDLCC